MNEYVGGLFETEHVHTPTKLLIKKLDDKYEKPD